jgi:hypothetical protein
MGGVWCEGCSKWFLFSCIRNLKRGDSSGHGDGDRAGDVTEYKHGDEGKDGDKDGDADRAADGTEDEHGDEGKDGDGDESKDGDEGKDGDGDGDVVRASNESEYELGDEGKDGHGDRRTNGDGCGYRGTDGDWDGHGDRETDGYEDEDGDVVGATYESEYELGDEGKVGHGDRETDGDEDEDGDSVNNRDGDWAVVNWKVWSWSAIIMLELDKKIEMYAETSSTHFNF